MKESVFKFTDPKILETEFYVNKDFDKKLFDKFKITSSIEHDSNANSNEAFVALEIIIGEKNSHYPFYIRSKNCAKFLCKDKDLMKKLVVANAPALLLSYLRPYISLIVSQAGFNSFNIPFMDFSSEYKKEELDYNNNIQL